MCQEFGGSLVGRFWPEVSHEVAIKMSARPVIIWSLEDLPDPDLAWFTFKMVHSWGWKVSAGISGRPQFFPTWASSESCLNFLTVWWLVSPRTNSLKDRNTQSFLWPSHENHILLPLPFVGVAHILGSTQKYSGKQMVMYLWERK